MSGMVESSVTKQMTLHSFLSAILPAFPSSLLKSACVSSPCVYSFVETTFLVLSPATTGARIISTNLWCLRLLV